MCIMIKIFYKTISSCYYKSIHRLHLMYEFTCTLDRTLINKIRNVSYNVHKYDFQLKCYIVKHSQMLAMFNILLICPLHLYFNQFFESFLFLFRYHKWLWEKPQFDEIISPQINDRKNVWFSTFLMKHKLFKYWKYWLIDKEIKFRKYLQNKVDFYVIQK